MKKVTVDEILDTLRTREEEKRQAEKNEAYLRTGTPESVQRFEFALNDAVSKINNVLSEEQRIIFEISDKVQHRGSLRRGRVCYQYAYMSDKLSVGYSNRRGSNSESFLPSLAQECPFNGGQDLKILWASTGSEKFTAEELAASLLYMLIEDF